MAIFVSPVCICIFKKSGKNPSYNDQKLLGWHHQTLISLATIHAIIENREKSDRFSSVARNLPPPRPPTLGTTSIPFSQLQDSKTPAYDVIARFKSIYHGRNKSSSKLKNRLFFIATEKHTLRKIRFLKQQRKKLRASFFKQNSLGFFLIGVRTRKNIKPSINKNSCQWWHFVRAVSQLEAMAEASLVDRILESRPYKESYQKSGGP